MNIEIQAGDEVYVDMPGLCIDGRFGIVVGWSDYPAIKRRPAERRYRIELFSDAPCPDELDPAELAVVQLTREELHHVTWRANRT